MHIVAWIVFVVLAIGSLIGGFISGYRGGK